MVLRARGPDFLLAPGSCERPRPQLPSHRRSHRCKMSKTSRCSPNGSPAWISPRLRSKSPSGYPATPAPAAASRKRGPSAPPAGNCWPSRTGCAAGESPRSAWRGPATTGNRCSSCWNRAGSTATCTTPRRSRRCPAGRLDLACQDHRAGHGLLQFRAARADLQAPHPHPLPPPPHPGPHRREAAGRETAGRRVPEAVGRNLRHSRGLGPGHAQRARRRATRPQGTGAAGPRHDARQDPQAGGGAGLLLLHRSARRRAGDDAGHHRLLHHPDRGAHRQDREAGRTLPAPGPAAR